MKNITEKEIIESLRKCPRFNWCSINICPLDLEADLRNKPPEENQCPFTINKKSKSQKGIRTQMSSPVLKVIPELNVKMLNRGNQKLWHGLQKKDG